MIRRHVDDLRQLPDQLRGLLSLLLPLLVMRNAAEGQQQATQGGRWPHAYGDLVRVPFPPHRFGILGCRAAALPTGFTVGPIRALPCEGYCRGRCGWCAGPCVTLGKPQPGQARAGTVAMSADRAPAAGGFGFGRGRGVV